MERILGSLDRRTFLSAGGAFALSLGGLSALGADVQASSVTPERPVARLDPRRALKPLAVNRVTVKVGAAKPFKVLHVSDTHFTFCDARDDARKQKLAASRIKGMRRGEHYLDEAFRLAADEGAVLMHTGDLIDFTSKANYDAVVEHFAGRDSFVCAGNHEFVPYFWETDKEDAAYKAKSYAATQANFPNDLTFAARVVNGVNFVAIDDVFYYTTERQAELFEREVAKGLPIVLLCHVPLYSPELFKVAFKKWRTAAYLCGVPDGMMSRYRKRQVEQQRADKTTMDFVSRLRSEPLLKAILCGHIHTTAFDRFSPTACSYVAGANFAGDAQMVTFT